MARGERTAVDRGGETGTVVGVAVVFGDIARALGIKVVR